MNCDALKVQQVAGCVRTTTERSNGGSTEAGVTSRDPELKGKWRSGLTPPVTELRHNPHGVDDAYVTWLWQTLHTREATGNIMKVWETLFFFFFKGVKQNNMRQEAKKKKKEEEERE